MHYHNARLNASPLCPRGEKNGLRWLNFNRCFVHNFELVVLRKSPVFYCVRTGTVLVCQSDLQNRLPCGVGELREQW